MRPHVALSPVPIDDTILTKQRENETAWCLLLTHRILPLVLPSEDLQNPCLNAFVSEVLAGIVLQGGICGKASEPWLLWEGVTKLLRTLQPARQPPVVDTQAPISRLEQFGLLASGPDPVADDHLGHKGGRFHRVSRVFWSLVQLAVLSWILLRSFVTSLMQAKSMPERKDGSSVRQTPGKPSKALDETSDTVNSAGVLIEESQLRPIISMKIWDCINQVIGLEQRMPWLSGILSLIQWVSLVGPGRICCTNSRLDR